MSEQDINTEQAILQAAEQEFFEKGFSGAKTTEIAKRAGVNHAMLHYYFRTKENLFNMVFEKKANFFAGMISSVFEQDLPFLDKIKLGIETHFDIIAKNPTLPFFIYSEIIMNKDRKDLLLKVMLPKITRVLSRLKESINAEVAKGTIDPVEPIDLLFSIISLNIVSFLAQPLIENIGETVEREYHEFLKRRKEYNVQLILKGLKK